MHMGKEEERAVGLKKLQSLRIRPQGEWRIGLRYLQKWAVGRL